MSENPTIGGMPGIHTGYYEKLFKAVTDCDSVICLHIGTGNVSPHCSPESPVEANITTMPMAVSSGASDWIHLEALNRYPHMKVCFSESGIGWIPYLLERADFTHEQHSTWTHSKQYLSAAKPSDVWKRQFFSCFVDDAYGLQEPRPDRRGFGHVRGRLSALGRSVAGRARKSCGPRSSADRRADRQDHAPQRDAHVQLPDVRHGAQGRS